MSTLKVTAIILTANESQHLKRCISSISNFVDKILVIDSGSEDDTVEVAKSMGAEVYYNPWVNYSKQFNFGMSLLDEDTDWVLRIDADEFFDQEASEYIRSNLISIDASVSGLAFVRVMTFLGKKMMHGGVYPIYQLRLFRRALGECEERWMDEHIVLSSGSIQNCPGLLVDDNLNSITWWTGKHNSYSSREAVDILHTEGYLKLDFASNGNMNKQAANKRTLKKIYTKLPIGIRSLLYFIYRFFLKLGFLDGYRGLIFCVLQGFWYRFLVDTKVYEVHKYVNDNKCTYKTAVKDKLNINV